MFLSHMDVSLSLELSLSPTPLLSLKQINMSLVKIFFVSYLLGLTAQDSEHGLERGVQAGFLPPATASAWPGHE